ncbi:MAG: hypothetical protein E7607_08610 [Ruminococcaceae bacterium]|nr:hypothetical protein [Oscillospiraceae bacterium]
MKKIFVIILSLLLCVTVISCQKAENKQTDFSENATQSTESSDSSQSTDMIFIGPIIPIAKIDNINELKRILELSEESEESEYREFIQTHDMLTPRFNQTIAQKFYSYIQQDGMPLVNGKAEEYELSVEICEEYPNTLIMVYNTSGVKYSFSCKYGEASDFNEPEGPPVVENIIFDGHTFNLYKIGERRYHGRFVVGSMILNFSVFADNISDISFDYFYIGSLTDIK